MRNIKEIQEEEHKKKDANMKSPGFKTIGKIRTPYKDQAPYQPVEEDEGNFYIELKEEYTEGLLKLERFKYIYVIYYADRAKQKSSMVITPSWTQGITVGLFASRSPARPNPIGISVVKVKKIIRNEIHISGIDAFDNTPLLDIKPYLKDLDSKEDADYGWAEELKGNNEHLLLHIKGIPHDY